MSTSARRWFFRTDESQLIYVYYEDETPLVNPRTKAPFGSVCDILPSSAQEAPPHAIEVRIARIPYSRKFSRGKIFVDFAVGQASAKIKSTNF